jgi:hypothetical protein
LTDTGVIPAVARAIALYNRLAPDEKKEARR